MKRTGIHKPTIEDVIEASAIETLHPGGLALTRHVGQNSGMGAGKTVLDVSCGRGTHAVLYAREFGAKVTGIDISEAMLTTARAKAQEASLGGLLDFIQADSQDLPFRDGEFDIVVNECAVGIPDDSQKVLDEMARVTRPGGLVLIHESIWRDPPDKFNRQDFAERYGTTPLAPEQWVDMMERAGIGPITVEDEPWSRPEMFWKIRADRDVQKPSSVLSPIERIKTIINVIGQYGLKGALKALENEQEFFRVIKNGWLGYALFMGAARRHV